LSDGDPDRMDPADVAALYVEHATELHRFLAGVLRDSQLAHDVIQTTFVRLVEKGHRTRQGSRKAWLFRVAYREAMAIRRRQAVGLKVLRQVGWHSADNPQAADVPLVRFESIEAVRRGLEKLSPEQQAVVRKRIYEEKTFAVIARELGIPLGTALGRMRSALARLRDVLGKHEP